MIEWKNLSWEHLTYPDTRLTTPNIYFITGDSGVGKSTLLYLLNERKSKTSGDILYNDTPIEQIDPLILRQHILLVEQAPFLLNGTIKENFTFIYEQRQLPLLSDEKMMEYLTLCCLDKPLSARCDSLSGGERQRVFLAIAFSLNSEVLLLDEPTSALNETLAHQLMDNIIRFAKKHHKTLMIVSHSQSLIDTYGQHQIHIGGQHESSYSH